MKPEPVARGMADLDTASPAAVLAWHASLPWDTIKRWYAMGRRAWFSRPRPEGEYFVVSRSGPGVEAELGKRSWSPNWEQSYNKRGEELNLAQVVYNHDPDHPGRKWWQSHVRGWPHNGGDDWALRAHWELEPTENPRAHLRGVGVSVDRGMASLEGSLRDAGYEPEVITWTRG